MKREAFAMRIKPGRKDEFKRRCTRLGFELPLVLEDWDMRNFSVWCVEDLVFGYGETCDGKEAGKDESALIAYFLENMRDCCDCLARPASNPMRLMYEDIGIVREDKSVIRHRVFATRLKPGCTEEYKRRHDELIASRGGRINPGPESNFTIWNTVDYIIGYCELDKTMEHEPTKEEMQGKIKWETRMLEIMNWITDDVDWLTGLKHDKFELMLQKM